MSELARIRVLAEDEELVSAAVEGEIDASNAARVLRSLESVLTGRMLVVDLSRLGYLDSAGVQALFALAETAGARRARVSLVVPDRSPVRRVLEVAGVERVLTLESPTAA